MRDVRVPESCYKCSRYLYKGDDEQYCQAAHMRNFTLKRWQKRPKWCPIERGARKQDEVSKVRDGKPEQNGRLKIDA